MSYSGIVFDWDGTLCDSANYIVANVQSAARQSGLTPPSRQAIYQVIGLSFEVAIKCLFSGIDGNQLQTVIKYYNQGLKACSTKPTLFNGVIEVLTSLKAQNYLLAIATGKGRCGLEDDLARLEIKHFFTAIRCGDEVLSKPHPQMLNELIEELMILPKNTLMVGDSQYDMALAYNAGVEAVAVTYGIHSKKMLSAHRPKFYIDNIQELLSLLSTDEI